MKHLMTFDETLKGATIKGRLLFLVFWFFIISCAHHPIKEPSIVTQPAHMTIAVLPFKNLSNDEKLDWLCEGIAESITTEFAKDKKFTIVEKSQIDKIYKELAFGLGELVDPATAQEMGKMLDCDSIISGSFQKSGKKIKVDARRIESETGKVYEAVSVIGSEDNIFALYEKLTKKLLESFEK